MPDPDSSPAPPLIPPQFLFRYSFAVQYVARMPRQGKSLLGLPASCAFPNLAALDGPAARAPAGALRLAWNAAGLGVAVEVQGKSQPPRCLPDDPAGSDGLQVWFDTRNTQSIHRASRFCCHFCLLPHGGQGHPAPVVVQRPIARAREEAPADSAGLIRIRAESTARGYLLEAWFPAEALHGFDPEANPRLGFYYALNESELGPQYLSVNSEFPFATDPSLWSTLELTKPRAAGRSR